MIPERIRRVPKRRWLVSGLLSRTVRAVGRNRPPLERTALGFGHGPPFRNQHVRIPWGQLESIANGGSFQIDAIDHVRIFPDETDGPHVFLGARLAL